MNRQTSWVFPLSGGRCVHLVFTGPPLEQEHIDHLMRMIQLAREGFPAAPPLTELMMGRMRRAAITETEA